MWLFISSEILLFGGLFLLYTIYRLRNPAGFHAGSLELSRFAGTLNTLILITSSLTAALAVSSFDRGLIKRTQLQVSATILLALAFLMVKVFEWTAKFEHGLFPGAAHLSSLSQGEGLFFGLYFMMTGLHALHVTVGIGIFTVVIGRLRKGLITAQRPAVLENSVLYWHLVDIIWIFLFPLLYLIT
jgi:cytochrome c oxidase subunit 3